LSSLDERPLISALEGHGRLLLASQEGASSFSAARFLHRVTGEHNLRVARALAANNEPALLSALKGRGAALHALLSSGDVPSALALARGAPRARDTLSPAARALQQDAWASATVEVSTLRGVPLPGAAAPPHLVYFTFPDGRDVRVHPTSVGFAGLPVAGSAVPVQGFFFNDMFVADRDGAECGTPSAETNREVECVVGGEALTFESRAAAEAEVAARRRAGARGLQMGADPALAPAQPYFSPALTKGTRSVLLLNVKFKGQASSSAELCTMAQVYNGSASLIKYHGERSFGAVTISTTVVNCVLELNQASQTGYATPAAMINDALLVAKSAPCGALTDAQIAAFHHRVVYHPKTSADPFDYHGLGSMSGCVSSRAHDALQSFPTRAHAHPPRAILTPRYASRATPPHTHTHFSGKTCG
jgi:hypothetical protein